VILLPALSALIAFGCVAVIARDALRRTTPDRIAWIIAFATFGIAATAEVIGDTAGWTAPLARLYYLTGAVLVVGYLALGQLYLLFPDRIRKVAPGVALLVTAVSASTVWGAPIDRSRLAADGWDAITRTTGLTLLAVSINSVGTLILLGGLVYSAIRFKRSGRHRNRMIGCLLIALGTLAVAMGGTLTRFGSEQYLYIAMSIGIGLIFAGYGWMKRREGAETRRREGDGEQARRRAGEQPGRKGAKVGSPTPHFNPSAVSFGEASLSQPGVSTPGSPATNPFETTLRETGNEKRETSRNPGIAFIETRLHSLTDGALAEECRVWSVPAREIDAFNRAEARRVWSFRNRLTPEGQLAFDERPASLRLQLTELYFEVMTAEIAAVDRPPVAPIDRLAGREISDAQSARAAGGSVD
jgi:hypothetical protein